MQQQLNQMQQKDSQMQQMQKMAQAMDDAMKSMQQGDGKSAAEAMDQIAQQLGDMADEMSELEDLESALDSLSQAKDQMRCQDCGGAGCKQCQGNGMGQQQFGMGNGDGEGEGNGLGRGNGFGDRPEEEGDTNTYETQVRSKVRQGKAIIAGYADGPNRKGVTRESLKSAIQGAISEKSNPAGKPNAAPRRTRTRRRLLQQTPNRRLREVWSGTPIQTNFETPNSRAIRDSLMTVRPVPFRFARRPDGES